MIFRTGYIARKGNRRQFFFFIISLCFYLLLFIFVFSLYKIYFKKWFNHHRLPRFCVSSLFHILNYFYQILVFLQSYTSGYKFYNEKKIFGTNIFFCKIKFNESKTCKLKSYNYQNKYALIVFIHYKYQSSNIS